MLGHFLLFNLILIRLASVPGKEGVALTTEFSLEWRKLKRLEIRGKSWLKKNIKSI